MRRWRVCMQCRPSQDRYMSMVVTDFCPPNRQPVVWSLCDDCRAVCCCVKRKNSEMVLFDFIIRQFTWTLGALRRFQESGCISNI